MEVSVSSPKAGIILIGIRGRHHNGWTAAEYESYVEEIDDAG